MPIKAKAPKKVPVKKPVTKKRVTKRKPAPPAPIEQKSIWHSYSGWGPTARSSDAFGGQPEPSQTDLILAYQDVVYACVTQISWIVATTELGLYVRTGTGQRKPKCETAKVEGKALHNFRNKGYNGDIDEVLEHPVISLLNHCNGWHNRIDLIKHNQEYMDLCGNGYWLKVFNGLGVPEQLFTLPSHLVSPIRDANGFVVGWNYGQGSEQKVYSADQIIHFKYSNPFDPFGLGMSPLRGAWQRNQIANKELGYLANLLDNMARPDAVLSLKDNIHPDAAENLAKQFHQRMQGQGAGGIFVTDGTMNFAPINYAPKDLAELQMFEMVRNIVSNCYGIPPDLWLLGNANRATADAVLYMFAKNCIEPRVGQFLLKLNQELVHKYYDERLFFAPRSPVVPADQEFLLKERDFLVRSGAATRADIQRLYGLPVRDWAEEPLLPSGSLPAIAPEVDPTTDTPAELKPDLSQHAAAITTLQTQVYSGAIPRAAAIAQSILLFSFNQVQAEALFPDIPPKAQEQPQQPATAPQKAKAVDLPVIEQQGSYDCGAACISMVTGQPEADLIQALGTTPEAGTSPEAMVSYLTKQGYQIEARNDLTIEDLTQATGQGFPIIVCLQDYEDKPEDIANEVAGHYVVVVDANDETITLNDPVVPDRVSMPAVDFLSRWEDTDGANEFIHYGIIVMGKSDGKSVKKKSQPIKLKSPLPLVRALQNFFRKQRTEVLQGVKSIKAMGDPQFDIKSWSQAMFDDIRPYIHLYYDDGAKDVISMFALSPSVFQVVQPKLKEGVDKACMVFCEETQKTTHQEITNAVTNLRAELTQGLIEGDVKQHMLERVKKVFSEAETSRAWRIGQTEANRGQHAAAILTAKETGVAKGKKWVASANACPECLALNGNVVGLDENFAVEGSGPYAAIPHAPKHPQCFCTFTFVTEEE